MFLTQRNAELNAKFRRGLPNFIGITSVPYFIISNKVQVKSSASVELFLQAFNRAALMEAKI
ncbi:hypothetical protein H6G69_27625 [Nostoc sp. FACHB-110]|nr:hypothetical protein [Nostoc sp. FACHB-110]